MTEVIVVTPPPGTNVGGRVGVTILAVEEVVGDVAEPEVEGEEGGRVAILVVVGELVGGVVIVGVVVGEVGGGGGGGGVFVGGGGVVVD